MPTGMASRIAETAAVDEFLNSTRRDAGALVLEGDAGIGKSTLLIAAVEQARGLGYQVLVAHPAQAESVLAYAALTDLLGDVDPSAWDQLPPAQRHAVDRVMLWDDAVGPATDQRAVAAGFLTLVEVLADRGPLLLVIDDAQWLDPSSAHVVGFVARRLPARTRMLLTVRTGPDGSAAIDWLALPTPDAVRRVAVRPLSLGGLHAVLSDRLGRSFPRPMMARIRDISGGNPFFAIELARAMSGGAGAGAHLPTTLSELVRGRLGDLDPTLHECLLAAACLASPTVETVARAVGCGPAAVVDLMQEAESKGLIEIDGLTLRFAHPLLSHGVYTEAAPGRRRAMHRRLAGIVDQTELRARHLALGATVVDEHTLQALDEAAESARNRGAPAAAAEFTDLAIGLGGDTPTRRVRSATMHFSAGDNVRARAALEQAVAQTAPGEVRAEALRMLGIVLLFADSFVESAALLERAVAEARDNLAARVPMLITLSFALVNSGRMDDAIGRARSAIDEATLLGDDHLLSQALSMNVVLGFMRGDGYDEQAMARALDLEDSEAHTPVAFRPRAQYALLQAWIGHLDESRRELAAIRRQCLERGEESELIFVAFHQVMAEVWAGDLSTAALIAEDFMERALQLGTDLPLSVALTTRALLAAYAGRADDARADAREALAAGRRCGSTRLMEWPVTAVGFLEVSLGNHRAALDAVTPLLVMPEMAPNATEVIGATFIPDAVEAMIGLGELDHAQRLTTLLEHNGSRLDRPWMSAVGARCRAMLLAARGDVDEAARSAEVAMAHHDRVAMPFERARTQLLLGQLHRRRRHKDAAAATIKEALAAFEQLGVPLWADRARAELGRANVAPQRTGGLTPSERRVAELAATGMTNREVAAALFISPKTVEANLARIYRKLGIRSRAELGRLTPFE
ncbi:LuxR C-terminal-related transcriptional regulator [Mycobacterium sp. CPCC 205372]|uniref:LuxR C-terminal-related transcriptional regulator n=1 Tax=Mycobacterium hippophais TaxID=3016340 RepID=A0ABT4PP87_9MYCO|nr:LuxR family transcriptional regulator [Mycobacterium hippophais]MCZ8378291.1 LuxR C-terminal-related transcriptional regulator [Mycobacterium hippophais]